MPRDDDQSLGGEQTFSGKVERDDSPQSLGDDLTFGDSLTCVTMPNRP